MSGLIRLVFVGAIVMVAFSGGYIASQAGVDAGDVPATACNQTTSGGNWSVESVSASTNGTLSVTCRSGAGQQRTVEINRSDIDGFGGGV